MPTFEIELDDGRKFHVDADNQQSALSGVQQMFGGQQQQKPDTSIVSAPAAGAGQFVSGLGKTMKHYLPDAAGELGASLEKSGEGMVPKGYEGAQVYSKDKGLQLDELPRKVAESAPGAAAGLAAAKLTPGPWYLKALMGAGTYLASQAGNRAEERAVSEGGDAQHPTTQQKTIGALTAGAESIPAAIGVGRLLPGAGGAATRVGAQGVADAVKRAAGTAAVEGGVGASQSAIQDVGNTAGTEGGVKIDPAKAIDAGLGNAALSPVFSGARTAREASEASKYRNIDPATAKLVANDLHAASDGKLDARGGYEAVNAVETNYRVDINNAVKAFEQTAPLSGEAQGVVERAKQGQKLTERDLNIIDNVTATIPGGDALAHSVRKSNTLAHLKSTGDYSPSEGKFAGGVGRVMDRNLRALTNPVAAGAGAGLIASGLSSPGMLSYSPHALATILMARLGALGVDQAMGNRSPVKQFIERFAGKEEGTRPTIARGDSPTGPKVRPFRSPWETATPPKAPVDDPQKLLTYNPQEGFDSGPGRSGPIPQPDLSAMPLLAGPRGPASAMREPTAPINQPMDQRLALPAPTSIQMPDQSAQPQLPAPLRALLPALRRMQLPAQPPENPGIAGGLGLEAVRRAPEPQAIRPQPETSAPVIRPQPDTQPRISPDNTQPRMGDDVVAAADKIRAEIAARNPQKREDLAAGTRARIANLKAQTEALRGKGATTDYTPTQVSRGPMEMPDIPDFLKRTKGEPAAPAAAPTRDLRLSDENPRSIAEIKDPSGKTVGSVQKSKEGWRLLEMRNGDLTYFGQTFDTPSKAVEWLGSNKEPAAPQPEPETINFSSAGATRKRPVAVSALAKKLADQHNAEVNRKPIVQDAAPEQKPQGKSLSMAEEMNQDSVLNAVKNGATEFAAVRTATKEDVDIADLKSTLTRMRIEGLINVDGKGKYSLPGNTPKAEEPITSSSHYVKGDRNRTLQNIINKDWVEAKGYQPFPNIKKGMEKRIGFKHDAADAIERTVSGVDAEALGQRLIAAGNRTEGRSVVEQLRKQHPKDIDAINKVFTDDFYKATWNNETSKPRAQPLSKKAMSKSDLPLEVRTAKLMSGINKSIDEAQHMRSAINSYVGAAYKTLNSLHRKGDTAALDRTGFAKESYGNNAGRHVSYREISDLMDKAISKAKLASEMTLYRGVGQTLSKELATLKPGQTITDKAFMSTSQREEVANGFASGSGILRTLIEITAPKGTHALDVGILSKRNVEKEIIFPRNTVLRYIGRTSRFNRNLTPIYRFEIVRNDDRQ